MVWALVVEAEMCSRRTSPSRLGRGLPLEQLRHDDEPVLYWYWPIEQLLHVL